VVAASCLAKGLHTGTCPCHSLTASHTLALGSPWTPSETQAVVADEKLASYDEKLASYEQMRQGLQPGWQEHQDYMPVPALLKCHQQLKEEEKRVHDWPLQLTLACSTRRLVGTGWVRGRSPQAMHLGPVLCDAVGALLGQVALTLTLWPPPFVTVQVYHSVMQQKYALQPEPQTRQLQQQHQQQVGE